MPSATVMLPPTPPRSVSPPPPPRVVGPKTKRATRPTNKLPQSLIDEARSATKEDFDPARHLNFQFPERLYTMKEIGLEGHGISPIAASEPFPLFTTEAVRQMRAEIFSERVLKDCQYASSFATNMVRGMGRERAPFTCDAWSSPELLSKISKVADIELTPAFDYEIANINIAVGGQTTTILPDGKISSTEDDPPAFAWHFDSFPFVCVTMLSDCTGMVGGETAIKTPSGEIKKIRGPAMGTTIVMQGRYIEHQALKALGGRERISMVTAFRAKSPSIRDETVLTGSRPISNWSELYSNWTHYRLEVVEERVREMLRSERRRDAAKRPFDIAGVRKFLREQKAYLETTMDELIEMEDTDENPML